MSKKVLPLVALLAVSVAAIPLFARASHREVRDGNDVPMALDVHRVNVEGSNKPRWIITTWGKWTVRQIYDRGYLMVRLDTFGDKRPDYYALVRSIGSKLEGLLFRDRARKPDKQIARLNVFRPSKRSVKIAIPLNKMRRREVFYRWFVETLMTTDACPRVCFDRAPNTGAVQEPESQPPTPTPTVTITPTITPSPTVTP